MSSLPPSFSKMDHPPVRREGSIENDVEEPLPADSQHACEFSNEGDQQPIQQTLPQHLQQHPQTNSTPSRNDSRRIYRQHHHHTNMPPPPPTNYRPDSPGSQSHNSNSSNNSHSPSPSSASMLAFLLFVGVAIAHAIASGFEKMHEPKQEPIQQQIPQQPEELGSFFQSTDDAVSFSSSNINMANNEVIFDGRSVNTIGDNSAPETVGTTATILSRASQLASLISHLDASDVVECYVVTRMAHLTNVANAGGSGNRKVQRMLDESMASASTETAEAKADEGTSTSSSVSTTNIPSGPILIRKSALAFRYRPRVASASRVPHFSSESSSSVPPDYLSPADQLEQQKYFELTLEYGPQRTGATKTSESMPMVHMDMELMGETNNDNNIGKYVTWENEGRVYHSAHISNEWTEAYYMAPITGVVMAKIIQRAVEYTYKRPRYQPFEVVSLPSRNLILRSSGSDDFVWGMFRDLADLYVDIDPLLVPPRGRVQFYVSDPEGIGGEDGQGDDRRESGSDGSTTGDSSNPRPQRKQLNPNVKQVKGPLERSRAAVFYENFFNCANAIKTGDYSIYTPPPSSAPTVSPTISMTPSMAPTMSPSIVNEKNETLVGEGSSNDDVENTHVTGGAADIKEDNRDTSSDVDEGENDITDDNITMVEQHSDDVVHGENNTIEEPDDSQLNKSNSTGSLRRRYLLPWENLHQNERLLSEKLNNATDEAVLDTPETNSEDASIEEESEDIPGLSLGDDDLDFTDLDDTAGSEDDPAEAAEKAAIEAAKAAENAAAVVATNNDDSSNNNTTSEVIAATSEAAKAAIKAKDASHAARSKISAEALLSGDGDLMTSILSNCFSDPKYGIRKQEEILHEVEGSNGPEEESGHVIEKRDLTHVYIYLDGDVFIRLNLTAPYWGTISVLETVPPPHVPIEGRGDMIDWAIFMLILMGTLFGFVVMVHQLGFVIDKRLRFRHIFHPTVSESDWASDDEWEGEEKSPLSPIGGGFAHSELRMTVESIPTSMGGGGTGGSPPHAYRDHLEPSSLFETDGSRKGLDLEMAQLHTPNEHAVTSNTPKKSSQMRDEGTPTNDLPVSLRMKRDTPDLVERPSAKSFSKVNLPKCSPRTDESDIRKLAIKKNHVAPSLPLGDS
ncbi:hypothetical protein ACHAXR_010573 [Thalassiosira sp. AJA248-18]